MKPNEINPNKNEPAALNIQPTQSVAVGSVIKRDANGIYVPIVDSITVEEPLEIRVNGHPLAVTMRTPGHDEDLATGFLVTEGVISSGTEIRSINRALTSQNPENTISIILNDDMWQPNVSNQRFNALSASCGICGKTSIEGIRKHFPDIETGPEFTVDENIILNLPDKLRAAQADFTRTGGLHAAGIFDSSGNLRVLREDVGRHNAVDKIVGWALREMHLPLGEMILLVSGRLSLEILQKSLAAGVPIVAAVSAPSSLAVNFARTSGQTLIGFLRPPRMNIYSHPERIRRSAKS